MSPITNFGSDATAQNKEPFPMTSRRPRFSGHQTFPFRYGWLEKGYQYVKEERRFSDADALVHLGVGKTMVEAIRYWCDALGLTTDRGLSPLAESLLEPKTGWDPYLEDDASLWLLHWKLCSQQNFMSAATLLFGEMHKPEFDRQEWLELLRQCDSQSEGKPTSIPTLERDMECCLKMYTPIKATNKKRVLELSYACGDCTGIQCGAASVGGKLQRPAARSIGERLAGFRR